MLSFIKVDMVMVSLHNNRTLRYMSKNKINFSLKAMTRDWRDGSAVKSTGCASRGPRFNF